MLRLQPLTSPLPGEAGYNLSLIVNLSLPQLASADLDALLTQAAADNDILAVILFGSVARGEAAADSDVDTSLVLQPQAAVDPGVKRLAYLQYAALDVQVFQALPIYVRQRVLQDAQVLHVKDEDALYDVAFRTIREFEEFRPFYREYLEEVAHGGS